MITATFVENYCMDNCVVCGSTCNYTEPIYTQKDRSQSLMRRYNDTKAKNKANTLLSIIKSKYRNSGHIDEEEVSKKKNKNAEKKAKRIFQETIKLTFPKPFTKISASNISSLWSCLADWEKHVDGIKNFTKTELTEMSNSSDSAISVLAVAELCNGELVAFSKSKNVLNITIGFYTQQELSDFKNELQYL